MCQTDGIEKEWIDGRGVMFKILSSGLLILLAAVVLIGCSDQEGDSANLACRVLGADMQLADPQQQVQQLQAQFDAKNTEVEQLKASEAVEVVEEVPTCISQAEYDKLVDNLAAANVKIKNLEGQLASLRTAPPTATTADQFLEIDIHELEKQVHELINVERNVRGLSTLSWNTALSDIARRHSQDMVDREYYDHINPEGLDPCDRFEKAGYSIPRIPTSENRYMLGCAENIARVSLEEKRWYRDDVYAYSDYRSQQEVAVIIVKGWMNCTGHRENILGQYLTSEGIGVAVSNNGMIYITEDFS